ncbi:MAG: hypothetical protein AAF664_00865 [Planctomycetota bacterium]
MHSDQDDEHLRLLSIFHYVVAGLLGLFSLGPLIHLGFGIAILSGAFDGGGGNGPPPLIFGWLFVIFPAIFICLGMTVAVLVAIAGRKLSQRASHTYCLVIAGVACLFVPFGTVLGVLTFIVLSRPTVRQKFDLTDQRI